MYFSTMGRITITRDVHIIDDTMDRKDEYTLDLEEPINILRPLEVDQPIPDRVREVVPIGPSQFNSLTEFPEIRKTTQIILGPARYEGGKIMLTVEKDHLDHAGTYKDATNRPDQAKWRENMKAEIRTINKRWFGP